MKRTIALGAAWTASAAAAVGLGFLAVSLVDASASPGTQPVAATTTAATGSPSTATPSAPPVGLATAEFATAAGTVFADCTSGMPVLAGVPVAGWSVDDSNDPGEMEFKAGTERVEVYASCVGGTPVFRLDDSSSSSRSSGPSSSGPSSSSPSSSSPTSGGDDSSGRGGGGGHGSDDGPGDDSSVSGGGGHGSDDAPGDDSSGRGGGGHGSDD